MTPEIGSEYSIAQLCRIGDTAEIKRSPRTLAGPPGLPSEENTVQLLLTFGRQRSATVGLALWQRCNLLTKEKPRRARGGESVWLIDKCFGWHRVARPSPYRQRTIAGCTSHAT